MACFATRGWWIVLLVATGCNTGSGTEDATPPPAGDDDAGPIVTPGSDSGGGGGDASTRECEKPADCTSSICSADGRCLPASCADGAKNGDETDVDCGGSCNKCDATRSCKAAGDCATGVCTSGKCMAPACDDAVKNGDETDVDCGGATCTKCAADKACKVRDDCATDVCTGGKCITPACDDGVKNGTETGVDCGGAGCPRCAAGGGCAVAGDCASGVCTGLVCQPPACDDLVKNGDETDVDCGGATCGKCAVGKACKLHADCTSDGCGYDGTCAIRRSCTAHYGGDTCGAGGPGGQGAASWESCCATAPAGAGGVAMDKYKITSGRMRAFLERTGGDVRATVRTLRAAGKIPTIPGDAAHSLMEPAWDLYLPTSMEGCDQLGTCDAHPNGAGGTDTELSDHFYQDATSFKGIYSSAIRHVGGSMWASQVQSSQGCRIDAPGAHSYWMDKATQTKYFGDLESEHPQAEYDTRPINCTTYLMMQAFCLWDGGRLETVAEWTAAIGPATYPWGASPSAKAQTSADYYAHRFPDATDAILGLPATTSIEYADYSYSYEYPHLIANDFIVFMAPPGRLPKGRGPWGHSDLAYLMFENTSNVTYNANPKTAISRWAQSGSWEGHGYSKGGSRNVDNVLDKYGKMSGRCVYP